MNTVVPNPIVMHVGGSIAYGTNTAISDIDLRGIFCANKQSIVTPFNHIEQIQSNEFGDDTVLYELYNYIHLYLKGNPNILESLFVDKSDIVFGSTVYNLLRANRTGMLSRNLVDSHTGYAFAQMKRMNNHEKWISAERRAVQRLIELKSMYNPSFMDFVAEYFTPAVLDMVKSDNGGTNDSRVNILNRDPDLQIITPVMYDLVNSDSDSGESGTADFRVNIIMRDPDLQMITTKPIVHKWFVNLVYNYTEEKLFTRTFDIEDYNNREVVPFGNNLYALNDVSANSALINRDGYIRTQQPKTENDKNQPRIIVKFNEQEYNQSNERNKNFRKWKEQRNEKRAELEELYLYDTKHAMHTIRLLNMCEELITTGEMNVKRPDAEYLLSVRNGLYSHQELNELFDQKEAHIKELMKNKCVLPRRANVDLISSVLMQAQDMCWDGDNEIYFGDGYHRLDENYITPIVDKIIYP